MELAHSVAASEEAFLLCAVTSFSCHGRSLSEAWASEGQRACIPCLRPPLPEASPAGQSQRGDCSVSGVWGTLSLKM